MIKAMLARSVVVIFLAVGLTACGDGPTKDSSSGDRALLRNDVAQIRAAVLAGDETRAEAALDLLDRHLKEMLAAGTVDSDFVQQITADADEVRDQLFLLTTTTTSSTSTTRFPPGQRRNNDEDKAEEEREKREEKRQEKEREQQQKVREQQEKRKDKEKSN